jgi:hypothetical protein
MYQPAFTETFLALTLVVLWCRWLEDHRPRWGARISLAAGLAVVLSQLGAMWVLIRGGSDPSGSLVAVRWLGMGTCLASLAACAVLTTLHLARRSSA